MPSICYKMCGVLSVCKLINILKIDCVAWENECTRTLLALNANNLLHCRIFHSSRIMTSKKSTSVIELVSRQHKSFELHVSA